MQMLMAEKSEREESKGSAGQYDFIPDTIDAIGRTSKVLNEQGSGWWKFSVLAVICGMVVGGVAIALKVDPQQWHQQHRTPTPTFTPSTAAPAPPTLDPDGSGLSPCKPVGSSWLCS